MLLKVTQEVVGVQLLPGADLSAPDQGVAGVMVAAVGSLQESGFAARRATSRLKEMQTACLLGSCKQEEGIHAVHHPFEHL